jgi:hypothetical protein
MAQSKNLTREFLAERDLRIFKLRQAGVPMNEIARRFGVATKTVGTSISRQLEKMNREALMAYPEVLRMELERLDALQQAIWPMTQHRKVTMDDGTEMQVEPDLKAIQQVLLIMDRRSKLLGMEQNNVNIQMDVSSSIPIRATLAGSIQQSVGKQFSPEAEARKMLELMGKSGVMPKEYVDAVLSRAVGELSPIVDAEVVEDSEVELFGEPVDGDEDE